MGPGIGAAHDPSTLWAPPRLRQGGKLFPNPFDRNQGAVFHNSAA